MPCAPILADITVDGKADQGDRAADQAGLGLRVRSRDRPAGLADRRAAGRAGQRCRREWYSPTQPFPTKPPPFERQGFLESDVIDFTPELKAEALKIVSQYKIGPLFTPPIARGEGGKIGTLFVPNGANWPGGSLDPDTGILYVYSHTLLRVLSMVNDPKRSDMNYISTAAATTAAAG